MSHVPDGELTAYADGAYAPTDADAQRITAHLALCPDCRNRLEQAHALSARAAEILAVAAPAVMETPPFDEIRAHATARRAHSTFPLAWAATVILALGIGWFGRGALRNPDLEMALTRSEPRAKTQAEVVAAAPPPAPQSVPTESPQASYGAEARAGVRRAPQVAASGDGRDNASSRLSEITGQPQNESPPAAGREIAVADLAGAVAEERAAGYTGIEYITAGEAERRGIELHAVPELEILRVGLRADGVQVEQKLTDGKVITVSAVTSPKLLLRTEVAESARELLRKRQDGAAAPTREPLAPQQAIETAEAVDSVILLRGNVQITISGALPADSLRKIGTKIK
jgi:hypothetical protein